MNRSGYNDDCEGWELIRWRGAVASAAKGRRGQELFRDLLSALEAMPEKKLIAGDLVSKDGVCALGALGQRRGIDMDGIEPSDRDLVGVAFNIAPALAAEIAFLNDEYYDQSDEARYGRMLDWVRSQIKEPSPS